MKFHTYILYSKVTDRYYKGQTADMVKRLRRHNSGAEKSTKSGVPWVLECAIEKPSRTEALKLEKKLKNLNTEKTKAFIAKYGGSNQDVDPVKS